MIFICRSHLSKRLNYLTILKNLQNLYIFLIEKYPKRVKLIGKGLCTMHCVPIIFLNEIHIELL